MLIPYSNIDFLKDVRDMPDVFFIVGEKSFYDFAKISFYFKEICGSLM